jgi:hypothetical protein
VLRVLLLALSACLVKGQSAPDGDGACLYEKPMFEGRVVCGFAGSSVELDQTYASIKFFGKAKSVSVCVGPSTRGCISYAQDWTSQKKKADPYDELPWHMGGPRYKSRRARSFKVK